MADFLGQENFLHGLSQYLIQYQFQVWVFDFIKRYMFYVLWSQKTSYIDSWNAETRLNIRLYSVLQSRLETCRKDPRLSKVSVDEIRNFFFFFPKFRSFPGESLPNALQNRTQLLLFNSVWVNESSLPKLLLKLCQIEGFRYFRWTKFIMFSEFRAKFQISIFQSFFHFH